MIAPYTIDVPEHRLATIRAPVAAYDWSQLPDAGGWGAGVGIADLRRLVRYWLDRYDWRNVERRLNRFSHFMADIDGQGIHYIHVRGNGTKPPVVLIHGWPGSFLEFERLIEPLAEDGHDVIVPSLPGFAFSHPIPRVTGPRRTAALMRELMSQLFGSTRFIVQGETGGMASRAGSRTTSRTICWAST